MLSLVSPKDSLIDEPWQKSAITTDAKEGRPIAAPPSLSVRVALIRV